MMMQSTSKDQTRFAWWVTEEGVLTPLAAKKSKSDDEDEDEPEQEDEWEKSEEGYDKLVTGPNDTWKVDRDAMKKDQDRRANGFKLFGKYYQSLWD